MTSSSIQWRISEGLVEYQEAMAFMEERVEQIAYGVEKECCWILEHPPIYTAGMSAVEEELLTQSYPVYHCGRGGGYTYHGPGQVVVYVMLNLKKRKMCVRLFISLLEDWIGVVLKDFGLKSCKRPDEKERGVWVETPSGVAKIGFVGIRLRRWVTFHGVALNVCPCLLAFEGIIPCGLRDTTITSFEALGEGPPLEEVKERFRHRTPFVC